MDIFKIIYIYEYLKYKLILYLIMDRYQKSIEQAQTFLSRYIWIGVLLAILGVLWYYQNQ